MKKLLLLSLAAAATGAYASPVLWYGGDADTSATGNGLASERNAAVSDAQTYDNFTLASAATVDGVFGNFLDTFSGSDTTAFYDIRSGVSENNAGTDIAQGIISIVGTDTGTSSFGYEIYTYSGSITALNLAAGTYYLAISPINSGSGADFIATTLGANSVNDFGHPNTNQFINSSYFGYNYENWSGLIGNGNPVDASYGITGTLATPEPASMAVLGFGVVGLLRRRRASKK